MATALPQAEQIWSNILSLGARRLVLLAAIMAATLAAVGGSAYYLSRPQQAVLYSGLASEDVSRIGAALQETGIAFDVSADGTTVLVNTGSTARARMFLAERGLPQGGTAGYELFDRVDGLGLTSFMQEVTRTRALEGELARTIQTLNGVKAARVHLVLPERGTFRSDRQQSSASVVVRGERFDNQESTRAIRLLVSAAVPGLAPERVTVLDTTGRSISSALDATAAGGGQMADLEQSVAERLAENLKRTLSPHLGVDNFQISVTPVLNTDRVRMAETTFDPESRVERSIRTVRESEMAQNASTERPTTVEQNLPEPGGAGTQADRSNQEVQKREELVNYELSSRTTETTKDGYDLKKLSIALVVNRTRLQAIADAEGGAPVADQIANLERIAASAAGIDQSRGDQITVTAVDFLSADEQLTPIEPISILEVVNRHFADVIKAVSILIVTCLLIWFGLKPAVAALVPAPSPSTPAGANMVVGPDGKSILVGPDGKPLDGSLLPPNPEETLALLEDLATKPNRDKIRRLEAAMLADEDQAMIVLKQWLYQWGPSYASNSD
ncbi:flagellar basal-body MS-ring/collar protein FliF [Chthonobacter rhizosphaerae]|uniref:flagellar basal-body MS-ring/collar protein FliF n=1 Tax=Chthonobacter rhizosphaerae TaxID=2735553 RepID=UPI0015EFC8D3|nr:flagellar basal-body MS-ring/collar protein FliF [Chthonobacter rhizosphaerae]